ncbi:MAG: hypothetical protein EHM41_05420 [Chloroflexi bacterium]|nr:MAG: hypothetical protein EHM41_05420 [Chloroflexota bacterium]
MGESRAFPHFSDEAIPALPVIRSYPSHVMDAARRLLRLPKPAKSTLVLEASQRQVRDAVPV